jgi:hypothetical protein
MSQRQRFIVLIGGPGKFEACDREHDQTWSNYIVPIQVATKDRQLELTADEDVQWWIYAPAYRERWTDDVAAVKSSSLDRGRHLLDSRQKSVDKVTSSGASDYLDRIKRYAGTVNAGFLAIESPADFWKRLGEQADGSVTRLWYVGHASAAGLMLKLQHDKDCNAGAADADMIKIQDISTKSPLITSKLAKKGKPSKFYGCHTQTFAEQWNSLFGAAAEGAIRKIDFGLVDQPSKTKEVLKRLEKQSDWTSYGVPARP